VKFRVSNALIVNHVSTVRRDTFANSLSGSSGLRSPKSAVPPRGQRARRGPKCGIIPHAIENDRT